MEVVQDREGDQQASNHPSDDHPGHDPPCRVSDLFSSSIQVPKRHGTAPYERKPRLAAPAPVQFGAKYEVEFFDDSARSGIEQGNRIARRTALL
jgi:hypothetical protein